MGHFLILLILWSATPGFAAITSMEVTGASEKTITYSATSPTSTGGSSTATVTDFSIYGGSSGTVGATHLADNCLGGGSEAPTPCNNKRIHPSGSLTITFTAGAAGCAKVVATAGSTQAVLGTDGFSAPAGTTRTVVLVWSNLCVDPALIGTLAADSTCQTNFQGRISVGVGSSCSDYNFTSGEVVSGNLSVLRKTCNASNGESVAWITTNANTNATCGGPDSETKGVYKFRVKPGDAKVYLRDMVTANGGLTSTYGSFTKLRLYYLDVGSTTNPCNAGTGQIIQVRNNSKYIETTLNAITSTTAETDSSRFTGFQNDRNYVFKVAMVDAAGNVSHFTPDAVCNDTPAQNATGNGHATMGAAVSAGYGVHSAMPGEVVGLLTANDCFIATAAFESPMAPQVEIFRKFRDQFMLPHKMGRALVKFYYSVGPRAARFIQDHEVFRQISRGLLYPLLGVATLSLQFNVNLFVVIFLCTALFVGVRAQIRRRQ